MQPELLPRVDVVQRDVIGMVGPGARLESMILWILLPHVGDDGLDVVERAHGALMRTPSGSQAAELNLGRVPEGRPVDRPKGPDVDAPARRGEV